MCRWWSCSTIYGSKGSQETRGKNTNMIRARSYSYLRMRDKGFFLSFLYLRLKYRYSLHKLCILLSFSLQLCWYLCNDIDSCLTFHFLLYRTQRRGIDQTSTGLEFNHWSKHKRSCIEYRWQPTIKENGWYPQTKTLKRMSQDQDMKKKWTFEIKTACWVCGLVAGQSQNRTYII